MGERSRDDLHHCSVGMSVGQSRVQRENATHSSTDLLPYLGSGGGTRVHVDLNVDATDVARRRGHRNGGGPGEGSAIQRGGAGRAGASDTVTCLVIQSIAGDEERDSIGGKQRTIHSAAELVLTVQREDVQVQVIHHDCWVEQTVVRVQRTASERSEVSGSHRRTEGCLLRKSYSR